MHRDDPAAYERRRSIDQRNPLRIRNRSENNGQTLENLEQKQYLQRIKNTAKLLKIDLSEWTNSKGVLKWLAIRAIFLPVVLWFAYYTIDGSVPLIGGYIGGDTSSKATTMFNKSITLPNATICLPIIPTEIDEMQQLAERTVIYVFEVI